jgi:predicted RNA-binding protein with PIN domain
MHWLIDGHNLIGQLPGLHLSDPDDEQKLLEYLIRFRARTGDKITVFFDPGGGYQSGHKLKHGSVAVQFAPSGKTADQLIVGRLRRIKNQQAVRVVSSDRAVQTAARLAGVQTVKATDFGRRLLGGPGSSSSSDPGSQADVSLSANEIDEWLDLFNQQ